MNPQTLEGQYLGQIFQSKHNFEPQSYAKIITTGTASRKSPKLRFYYPPRPAPQLGGAFGNSGERIQRRGSDPFSLTTEKDSASFVFKSQWFAFLCFLQFFILVGFLENHRRMWAKVGCTMLLFSRQIFREHTLCARSTFKKLEFGLERWPSD